jgi:hypothetical protein
LRTASTARSIEQLDYHIDVLVRAGHGLLVHVDLADRVQAVDSLQIGLEKRWLIL